ncbi:MAG: GAF domain-containing protein [Candidatus Sulfotelmatobacter sp.]
MRATLASVMLGKMGEIEQLAGLDSRDNTPESICAGVAKIFHVTQTEVALLELGGSLLNFLYPAELKAAGAIPLSSSAVAARTARTKRAELFNSFTQVKHFSVFELVKLGDTGLDAQVIQKLMSAPVFAGGGEVIGVIQVSRKAPRPAAAGPNFTPDDLRTLESVALLVGRLMANPPVSNVFQSYPQSQAHRSSLRGDQPHRGQRMRGPDVSRSFSPSRSGVVVGVTVTGLMFLTGFCLPRRGCFGSFRSRISLPQAKPRTMREHLVVPSIRSREVACAQRSCVRHGEDAFQQLDFGDGSVNVHAANLDAPATSILDSQAHRAVQNVLLTSVKCLAG